MKSRNWILAFLLLVGAVYGTIRFYDGSWGAGKFDAAVDLVSRGSDSLPDSDLLSLISVSCTSSEREISEITDSTIDSIFKVSSKRIDRRSFLFKAQLLMEDLANDKAFKGRDKEGKYDFKVIASSLQLWFVENN